MSDKGVEVDPRKTEVVKNWPKPLTKTNIRGFLGFTHYYCRFIEGFSSIATTLTTLTKKRPKFESMDTYEKHFLELKDRLTSGLVLTFPKCDENYTIYSDASRFCLVCVLTQGCKVIAYAS